MLTANVTAIPIPVTTKTCTSCNIEKPLSEFSPLKGHEPSVTARCKPCLSADACKRRRNLKPDARALCSLKSVRSGMIARCYNPDHISYKSYGMRGIRVCQRWLDSIDAFIEDMEHRPTPEHQIDRIDNDGNYEPSNCRWVTPAENSQNQRMPCNNTSGITGVSVSKCSYQAKIMRNGILRQKYFKQRWDAICWRMSMENRYRETGAL